MNFHGQINAACENRPGHPQPCHWSVWIVLECGFHIKKMDFSSCNIMPGYGKSSHIYRQHASTEYTICRGYSQLTKNFTGNKYFTNYG